MAKLKITKKTGLTSLVLAGITTIGLGAFILISCSQKEVAGEYMLKANPRLKGAATLEAPPKETDLLEELSAAFFEYDKDELREDAKKVIRKNVEWLKKNPSVAIQIEGHCDERGSREYNLALGQRRAEHARDYAVSLGIAADRISTVSYGAMAGQNSSTWGSNRKAVFVLIYPHSGSKSEAE